MARDTYPIKNQEQERQRLPGDHRFTVQGGCGNSSFPCDRECYECTVHLKSRLRDGLLGV
jgi:hypothetical protein